MSLLLLGWFSGKELTGIELEDAIEAEFRRRVFREEDKRQKGRQQMLARQSSLEALREFTDLPDSDVDKIDGQVRQEFQQRVDAGQDLEETIEKEVRWRVFQEEKSRKKGRQQKLNQQAHLEAVREISDLPDSEVKKIEKEVRAKFRKRNEARRRRQAAWARRGRTAGKWGLRLAVVGALGAGANYFYPAVWSVSWALIKAIPTIFEPGMPELPEYAVQRGYNHITYAAGHEKTEKLQELLDRGLDVNAKDNLGRTAVMRAADRGWRRIPTLKFLFDKGAEVDLQDPEGRTALLRAVEKLDSRVAEALLAGGANPNFKDAQGRTAVTVAMGINRNKYLVKLYLPYLAGKQHRDELARRDISFDVYAYHQRVGKTTCARSSFIWPGAWRWTPNTAGALP